MFIVCARIPAISQSTRVTKLSRALASWKFPFEIWRSSGKHNVAAEENTAVIDEFTYVNKLPKFIRYALWSLMLAVLCRFKPRETTFWCVGFESALPLALFHRKGQKIIFDNNDNFSKSHNFPFLISAIISFLEKKVVERSQLHIVPGVDRWKSNDKNLCVIPNIPSQSALDEALEISKKLNFSRPKILTIYVCGWLTGTRGIPQLKKALLKMRKIDYPHSVLVAGAAETDEAKDFINMPNVNYIGVVTNEMALANCFRSTVMFTFYDPRIEINRLAEPNKWGDCVATNTPFICNQEIETAARYYPTGLCYTCPFDDDDALVNALCRIFDSHDYSNHPIGLSNQGWESLVFNALTQANLIPNRE